MSAEHRALRVLAQIARLVPAAARDGWRREWEGELAYHLRKRAGEAPAQQRRWLAGRLLSAARHAVWLRVTSPRPAGRARSGAWSDVTGDVKYALRGWRRSPGFSLTVVMTLALGLGLAAAIFSFADGYLFRPLPFPGGDRTYYVRDPHAVIASFLRATDLAVLRQSAVANYGFVEWSVGDFGGELLIGDRRVLTTSSYEVSPGFRKTLALPLVAGRDFTAEDHVRGAPKVVWLSHRFWQRELGGDWGVVGRTYRFESPGPQELRVVGILGPEVSSFDLNNQPPDMVVPEVPRAVIRPTTLANPLVLLPEGVTVEQASQQIAAALQAAAPAADGRPRTVRLLSLERAQLAGGRPTARVFFAGAMLILILASMNLVHLLLSRAAARAAEVATRAALGASRWRIARGFLIESLLLGACGIGTGLLVGKALSVAIESRVPQLPISGRNLSMVPMVFDLRVIVFAVTLGLIVTLAGGLWPAWRAWRESLASTQRTAGGGGRVVSHRLARGILASELTVATIVVVGAVFVGVGIHRYLNQPLGFDYVDRLRVSLSRADGRPLAAPDAAAALHAIQNAPGVAAVGHENTATTFHDVEVPSKVIDPKTVSAYGTTSGHFEAWGMKMRLGRGFEEAEYQKAENVAVVNETFARLAWPDASPLGETLRAGGVPRKVIGVVESRRHGLERPLAPMVFLPEPAAAGRGDLVVWTPRGDVGEMRQRLTTVVQAAAPGSKVSVTAITFDGLFSRSLAEARFQTPVVVAFGVLAVILAGVGVFGLVSYLVEQRRREFGIRMALGARRADVWRTVMRESVQPTLIGLIAGSAGAFALERGVQSAVFGWQSSGALSIAVVAGGLLVVAVVAALIPAVRAASVDPAITLRAE